jgi:site-specific DNA-methyltransferase (adenine-specific)
MSNQAQFSLRARNPDVLTCIANLSNDEVFTPPELAHQMLDALTQEWAVTHGGADIWSDPTVKFLDPCTKSGVFLREITSRLVQGLATKIPSLEDRITHILTKQVYGIAITHLTSLLARRSVYCSKDASGKHSVARAFTRSDGHIWFERTEHSWANGRCQYCGAGQATLDRGEGLESHAYAFIHTDRVTDLVASIFGEHMQFDVIIGNPPYQIEADDSSANIVPIYNKFVQQAKKLAPRFVTMVVPARWMAGGKWLDEFRADMLQDPRVKVLVDYPNAAEAFPGVDIKGGVCFFLWSRDATTAGCAVTTRRGEVTLGPIERRLDEFDVFVRDGRALELLRRVLARGEAPLAELVSPRDPFGPDLSSNFENYHAAKRPGDLWLYINQAHRRGATWIDPRFVTRNQHLVGSWKVLVPKAGPGNSGGHVIPDMVLSRPLIAEPNSVCTLSYLVVGPFSSKRECESVASYLRTRFARFLISLRKPSQDAPRGVYKWLPQQDWTVSWTDELLNEKYRLSADEIGFIESMIRPMDTADE